MIYVGEVTGQEIAQNKDGDHPVRLLQVEFAPDDVQTVEHLASVPGEDSAPPNGSRVIVFAVTKSYSVAIAVDDEIDPEAEEGERRLYASEGGQVKALIHLKKDGTIQAENENGNFSLKADGVVDINNGNFTVDP